MNWNLTDSGNAELFAELHSSRLRYLLPSGQWHAWNGERWALDHGQATYQAAKETLAVLELQALDENDEDMRKRIVKFARSCRDERGIKALVNLAAREQLVIDEMDKYDANKTLLNCGNGVLDLETGRLLPHNSALRCVRMTSTHFEQKPANEWRKFVRLIFDEDDELVDYIQKAVGYSLSGLTNQQCFFILHGRRSNGKSTFVNAIRDVMGEYASTASPTTFLRHGNDAIRNDLARLMGTRFVSASETRETNEMDEVLVKSLTGDEPIAARFLHRELFEYRPQFKIWLLCNHPPRINVSDPAIWRRPHMIPFNVSFWYPERGESGPPHLIADLNFGSKLRAEYPGILYWMYEGFRRWVKEGLAMPEAVLQHTRSYRHDMDSTGYFVEERCKLRDDLRILEDDLYQEYLSWVERNKEKPLDKATFRQQLIGRSTGSVKRVREQEKWMMFGISILQPAEFEIDSSDGSEYNSFEGE
jgi:putative DNA primase/helicase